MLKMTALHWAAEHNHRAVVELLVRYRAHVHALGRFDKSPPDIALDKNDPETPVTLQPVAAGRAAEETTAGDGGDAEGGEKPPAKRLKAEQNRNDVEESEGSTEGEAAQQRPSTALGEQNSISKPCAAV